MKYLRYFLSVFTLLIFTTSVYGQNGGNALSFDGTDDLIKVDEGAGTGLNLSGLSQFTT